jgi:hypothetical protein
MRRLRELWRVLAGLVRELSDESAYRRHLAHHGCEHSPAEWRRFADERHRSKFARPRCC